MPAPIILPMRAQIDEDVELAGEAKLWVAHDPETNSLVAIKVLRDALSAVVGRERFIREVRIASQLEHPRANAFFTGDLLEYYE